MPDVGNWSLPHICKEAVTNQNNNQYNNNNNTGPDGTPLGNGLGIAAISSGNYSTNLATAAADAFYQPQSLGALSTVTTATTVTSCGGGGGSGGGGSTPATTQQPLPQQHYLQAAFQQHAQFQHQQQNHQTSLHKFYKQHKKMPAFRGRRGWCGCLQVGEHFFCEKKKQLAALLS